jgi:hypothetical protein
MKKFNLTTIQISLGVISFILLLSSCTSHKTLSYTNYYHTRVVKREPSRNIARHAFSNRKIKKVDNIINPAVGEVFTKVIPAAHICQPGIVEVNSLPAVDIASIDNKFYVNHASERLTAKIRDLYKTETDVKSFRKSFKEIKRQQATKLTISPKKDDPKTNVPKSSVNGGLSSASLVFGIIGLFVAGIICGSIAIVCGFIGMNKGMKGVAIAGVILGFVDVVATLLVLGVL